MADPDALEQLDDSSNPGLVADGLDSWSSRHQDSQFSGESIHAVREAGRTGPTNATLLPSLKTGFQLACHCAHGPILVGTRDDLHADW